MNFTSTPILVVGDIMLDKYYLGTVDRISPEAPVPIVNITTEESRLGGASNVANNIATLGGNVILSGAIGYDLFGKEIERMAQQKGIQTQLIKTEQPTIVKARKINRESESDNSVILNLDRCRFDIRLHDKIPFTEKADRVIFRGSVKGSEQRRRFIETFRGNPRVDTADTRSGHSPQETGTAKQITLYAHLTSKFIMSFEGNDIASNTRWVMSTNSISVMPRPRRESWFMEGRLIPDYHYIEIKEDFSDLEEKMDYYISHPEKAQEIIDHANAHVRQFHDWRRERFISLLVMKKYFEMTGQLPRTSLW